MKLNSFDHENYFIHYRSENLPLISPLTRPLRERPHHGGRLHEDMAAMLRLFRCQRWPRSILIWGQKEPWKIRTQWWVVFLKIFTQMQFQIFFSIHFRIACWGGQVPVATGLRTIRWPSSQNSFARRYHLLCFGLFRGWRWIHYRICWTFRHSSHFDRKRYCRCLAGKDFFAWLVKNPVLETRKK